MSRSGTLPVDDGLRIGVDLGGTKIEAIALDSQGRIQWRQRVATPQGDYARTVAAVVALVQAAERQLGRQGSVGVGIPGAISSLTGRVKNANSVCLNGQPLAEDLARGLQRRLRLANDANCFAMSEAIDGAAAGAASVMGVILGTGVGAGLVFERRLITGCNDIAGEWGHNPLPPLTQHAIADDDGNDDSAADDSAHVASSDTRRRRQMARDETPGPRCYCGRFGCIETWLSGPGLAADHQRSLLADPRAVSETGESSHPADARTVIAAMRSGDVTARHSFDRYVDRLARGLATVVNIFDPHVIVLGGGLSQVDELYDELPAQLARYVFSDQVRTRVVRHRHGDSSGVRGAAWLWPAPA